MATINGTNNDETLNGTSEGDTITGFGGADQINGGDGSDTIAGGASTDSNPPDQQLDRGDQIDGGPGDDILRGGNGNDVLLGREGEDNLRGDLGDDTLDGGTNVDPIFGRDFEVDTVSYRFDDVGATAGAVLDASQAVSASPVVISDGRGGSDTLISIERVLLTGSALGDNFTGSSGDDLIDGRAGDDVIREVDGINELIGGAGDDTVFGGRGTDFFFVNASSDGADRVDLGNGGDRVEVRSAGAGQVRLTFTSSAVGNGSVNDPSSTPPQDGGLAVRFQMEDAGGGLTGPVSRYEDEDILFIATTPGLTFDVRDLVSGAARGDQFRYVYLGSAAGDGFDLVFNANQSAYANGGGGDDVLNGTTEADFLVGGSGDDILLGFQSADSFIGGAGNDSIDGGAGDDLAIQNVSTDGADGVDLGSGADRVSVNAAAPTNVRVTFTSAAVGNGDPLDAGTQPSFANLAVRLQAETDGTPSGPVSRYDDEGIRFIGGAGVTFDVRDLVSGAQRGETFVAVSLGTNGADALRVTEQAERDWYFNAGQGDDTIQGANGNDFLVGGAGNDGLTGGEGVNRYIGGGGNDFIVGGSNTDIIAAFNVAADGADAVNLGGGADVFNVSAPAATNVRLSFTSAEVGNGTANDAGTAANQDGGLAVRMQAETGGTPGGAVTRTDDEGITFIGQTGVTFDVRDLVSGAARGETFVAVSLGTSGADALRVTEQAERDWYFNAGQGDDTIQGADGNDFLVGGAGNDGLSGGEGVNRYIGGGGNDFIVGGSNTDIIAAFNVATDGADAVNLGGGMDVFNVSAPAATNVRLSFTSAEVGNGTANDAGTAANQDGGLAVRMQAETGGTPGGALTRADDEGITFIGGAGVTFDVRDLVSGAARGETFVAASLGTAGSDALRVTEQAGRDWYFNAGGGADTIQGADGNDFLVGGGGADGLTGGEGVNSFIGGGGNDFILGGSSTDTVVAFNVTTDGADEVNLGGGRDLFNVSATAATNVRLTFTSAEVGNGSANDSGTQANQDGRLAVRLQAEANGELTGAVSRVDDELITFVAGAGVTFDVRDLVSGTARGEAFEVVSLGGSGDDLMTAVQAARPYYFNGGQGADTILGGDAADFLVGGAGADTLRGGLGADSHIGGGGVDTFHFRRGDGADRVLDYATGADGDRLVVSGYTQAQSTTQEGADVRLTFSATDSIVLVGKTVADAGGVIYSRELTGGSGDDTLVGFLADDRLAGGAGNDTLYGQEGEDLLSGQAGDDVLWAGAGSDAAYGDEGADQLIGEAGDDQLWGFTGADRAFGNDGADVLVGEDGDDELWGGAGDDALYGSAGADTLIGEAGADGLFGGEGNDRAYGGDGADLLVGEGGADQLYGGAGGDVLVGMAGADLLVGEAGADTFRFDALGDSSRTALDRIGDFETGVDRIDLSALRQTATGSFTLTADPGGFTMVSVDANGDGTEDFALRVDGAVARSDFVF